MFDQQKIKELENKSHVRGKLNKEFYSSEQEQLEKKRREMKNILDLQVQENRKQKEKQKQEQDRKVQQEEERIRAYYAQLEQREKKTNNMSNSNAHQLNESLAQSKNNPVLKPNGSGIYDSRAIVHSNSNQYGYYSKQAGNQSIKRSNSRTQQDYDPGDIPVMPLMQSPEKDKQRNNESVQSGNSSQHYNNGNEKQGKLMHRNSVGNIPLLDLSAEDPKREKKKSKRNPTKREEKEKEKIKQRKNTFGEEEYIQANSRQQTDLKEEIFGDLNEELQEENKELKKQLKKKEQAISLLMGAVRSNAKLDKFRVQAERILHGQNSFQAKPALSHVQSRGRKNSSKEPMLIVVEDEKKEKESMLPKLKLHHQSIMHDYMFGSARKAQILKAKTFK